MRYQEMHPDKLIVRGQRVHCILYGGKDGVVVSIDGKQCPDTCRSLGNGVGVMGGNAHLNIVWDNGTESKSIPESLARGSVQWKLYDEVATEEQIAEMEAFVVTERTRRSAEETARQEAFQKEKSRLREEYDYLVQQDAEPSAFKRAIQNMRILLKRNFPKVKFSVRQEHHGCINVSWIDGPMQKQVEKLVGRFKAGNFDGMADMYEYKTTPWNSLFGDTEYCAAAELNLPAW